MKIAIILSIILFSFPLIGRNINKKELRTDSSKVIVRYPSEASIYKFKSKKDFIYSEENPQNWWDAFILWLNNQLIKVLGSNGFYFFRKYIGYIIILAAVLLILLVIKKLKFRGLFYNKKVEEPIHFKEVRENINEIDFEALISEAIAKKEFRVAVRLHYLKTLKLLAERGVIEWKVNKTNINYVKEIKIEEFRKPFEELTNIFEWIWYGELPVEESYFKKAENNFDAFGARLIIK